MRKPDIRFGVTTLRRNAFSHFALNLQYEFEDAFCEVTGGRLVNIPPPPKLSLRQRVLRKAGVPQTLVVPEIEAGLDVLFVPSILTYWLDLANIRHWRQKCGKVVYYLFDAWPTEVTGSHLRRHFQNECDGIYVSFKESVDFLQRHVKPRVRYLPQATDPKRFHFRAGSRPIFCAALARQDEEFLAKTKAYCRERDLLLTYSTEHGGFRRGWEDAQDMYAETLRHAKYSLHWSAKTRANWSSMLTVDAPTARWFQAAAAGSLLVGTPPDSAEWNVLFPPDSITDVREFNSDPAEVYGYLESRPQEELCERARTLSAHMLSQHTWQHRVRQMLRDLGMAADMVAGEVPPQHAPSAKRL